MDQSEPKPVSKLKILFLLLLVGSVIFGLTLYLFQPERVQNGPPSLKPSSKPLQGMIEKVETYHQFDEKYIRDYADPDWTKTIDKKDLNKYKKDLKSSKDLNYVYFSKDTAIQTIIESIIPKGDVFFALYNPSEDFCIKGKPGIHTYKEGPYNDSFEIKKTNTVIKAYCPIGIEVKEDTQIWGAKDINDKVSEAEFKQIAGSIDFEGWALLPLPETKDLLENFKESANNTIINIAGIEGDTSVKSDLSELDVKEAIAWINFGEPMICSDKSFSAGSTCQQCKSQDYRECNSEKTDKREAIILHFDEKKGSNVYDSANFNDGEATKTKWVTGIKKSALQFNGKDSQVKINKFSPTDLSEITISAWAKAEDDLQGQVVEFGKNGIYKDELKGWRSVLRIGDKNYSLDWKQTAAPKHSEWYFLAVTYDGEYIRFYVNGEEKNSIPKTGALNKLEAPMYIGSEEDSRYFNGVIDEVTVFETALDKKTIQEMYEQYIK